MHSEYFKYTLFYFYVNLVLMEVDGLTALRIKVLSLASILSPLKSKEVLPLKFPHCHQWMFDHALYEKSW